MSFLFGILVFLFVCFVFWLFLHSFYKPDFGTITLYFGSPGSGKSTFAIKDATRLFRRGAHVFTNFNYSYQINKDSFGKFRFPENSYIFFDEASVNGFDNRDFKENFKNNDKLAYIKYARHYGNHIIWYNQGYDELDKKIRTLCDTVYYVRKVGPFSLAEKLDKRCTINKETHEIVDGYYPPSLFAKIFGSSVRVVFRPRWYNRFDSFSRPACDTRLIDYPL